MLRTLLLSAALCVCMLPAYAQNYTLHGDVEDTVHSAIPYTTVSLLQPADSTLLYFGVSNAQGSFELKEVPKGRYLLQAAFLGFKTYYRMVDVPDNNLLGRIVLKRFANELEELEVRTDKVPIRLKGDTVEYNAGSFKTKPDANVEELLKKLPGVQVDKAGNIKAQGEDIHKVLVDGKEFFSNDPKVATKNLPADAISKVQVFNKHSDASEFTGIDDGSREKTINLQLKDSKKNGYFGDVQAGVGTNEHYKASAHLYKFKPKSQFAALGMLNNINQFGFSFEDYMNLSGGIGNMMNGGGFMTMNLGGKNAPPVDFGQPVYGLITSGAGGLNYTYEPKKNNRINVSYMGNGSEKKQTSQSTSENFLNTGTYNRNDDNNTFADNYIHRININARKDKDSVRQFTAAVSASLNSGHSQTSDYTTSLIKDMLVNSLDSRINDWSRSAGTDANLTYLRNSRNKKQVYKFAANASYQQELSTSQWNNITNLVPAGTIVTDMQKQDDNKREQQYGATASVLTTLGKGYFIEPSVNAFTDMQHYDRKQRLANAGDQLIDSLSPDFGRTYTALRPGIDLRKSTKKIQYSIGIKAEAGMLGRTFNNRDTGSSHFVYLLPSFNWQNEYAPGKRLNAYYSASVTAPDAIQLMPVANYSNPLQVYVGNNALRPEYVHSAGLGWLWFDEFSFSSLFANIGGKYTSDKITWARTINPDLTQSLKPQNVAFDYNVHGRAEYSKPIRKLGIIVNTSFTETYDRGISIINSSNNILTSFDHQLELSISNKKKTKWDVTAGGKVDITDAHYSIDKDFNTTFYSTTGFGEISYRPGDHWFLQTTADITQYNAQSFNKAVLVPLLKAEVSYYFLKAKRGTLMAECFDLLNRNTGLQRVSQLNFLSETHYNIIGRYFMLSFKYRLSKTGGGGSKMQIKMGH